MRLTRNAVVLSVAFFVLFLLLRSCGVDDTEIRELRAQLATMGDTAAVRDSTTRRWQDSMAVQDAAHATADSASQERAERAERDAGAAGRRFEDLASTLPDQIRGPLILAHEEQVGGLNRQIEETEGQRDRALERLVTRDATISALLIEKDGWQAERAVHERLAAELTKKAQGGINLGFIRLKSVVGVGCTVGYAFDGRFGGACGATVAVGR